MISNIRHWEPRIALPQEGRSGSTTTDENHANGPDAQSRRTERTCAACSAVLAIDTQLCPRCGNVMRRLANRIETRRRDAAKSKWLSDTEHRTIVLVAVVAATASAVTAVFLGFSA